jgi:hypothetical protein
VIMRVGCYSALLVFAALSLASAQTTDSVLHCDATMRVYRAEFDALASTGMTPMPGHPEISVRTAPASEFSLAYLLVANDAVRECAAQELSVRRTLSDDLMGVSHSVDAMLARRLLNYVLKNPERFREIDASAKGPISNGENGK